MLGFAGWLLAGTLVLVGQGRQPAPVKIGDTPEFSWNQPLVNGQGVTSLRDLRGKPVIVDFWGTH